MKYEQTDKSFKYVGSKSRILIKGDICIPFNGETRIPNPDVSWSHGLTHFLNVTTGREHFCGINWFEQNMEEIADA